MQMSRRTLFVFVESHDIDRYFYSMLVDVVCRKNKITYQIVTAEEVSDGDGGKQILLRFFDYLKRRSSLINRFGNKTTLSVFFLDKDVDNYRRVKRRSPHVVYTETYEAENYVFMFGDLCQAIGASTSLDVGSVRAGIGDYCQWRKHAASNWKDWVKLCLFSVTRNVASSCNYGRYVSPINQGCYGALLMNEYDDKLASVQSQSGMPLQQFRRSFERLSDHVDRLYETDKYDVVFKGKWYMPFMLEDIGRIAGPKRYNRTGIQERLISCLILSLNFGNAWSEVFREPLGRLIESAGITIS
jgi:hypothetical protein